MNKKIILSCLAMCAFVLAGCSDADSDKPSSEPPASSVPAAKNKYTVTWSHPDTGVIRVDENVEEGTTPVFGAANPTKASTAQYTYSFDGWVPAVGPISGNTTYVAHFAESVRSYTVSFVDDDDTPIHSDTLAYGSTPEAPANPSKDATAEYTYSFAGWDHALEEVHGDQTYKATYNATKNKYTAHFMNEAGTVELQTVSNVEYGAKPAFTESLPTKDKTAEQTFTFDGWIIGDDTENVYPTDNLPNITGDVTYKAHFAVSKTKYTVKFLNWNTLPGGDPVKTVPNVDYDADLIALKPTDDPVKEDSYDNYRFTGWTEESRDYTNYEIIMRANYELDCAKDDYLDFDPVMQDETIVGYSLTNVRTGYGGSKLIVPSTHEGKPVTRIAANMNYNSHDITNIVIPSSVTSIGGSAFEYSYDLVSVEIKGAPNIDDYAFANCPDLETVTIAGGSAYTIGHHLFNKSKATSVTFGEGLSSLTYQAFQEAQVETVVLPEGLTVIDNMAFYEATHLSSINLPSTLVRIRNAAFYRCIALEEIELPEGLTQLFECAFQCTNIEDIVLPDSLSSVGQSAFADNNSLKTVHLGENYPSDGFSSNQFARTKVEEFTINEDNDNFSVVDGVVYNKDVTAMKFYPKGKSGDYEAPSTLETLPINAFEGAINLGVADFSESAVTYITSSCFKDSGLTSFITSPGLQGVRDKAFMNTAITSLHFPASTTFIHASAFSGCNDLESLSFDSLTSSFKFENGALYSKNGKYLYATLPCVSGTFNVPSSVETIGGLYLGSPFKQSPNIDEVICTDNVTTLQENAFDSFSGSVTLGNGITSIPSQCFINANISSLTLPSGLVSIGSSAFYQSKVTSISLPDSCKTIGSSAFYRCNEMTTLSLGKVETIGNNAFLYCTKLGSVTIPSTCTSLGYSAFSMCSSMTSATVNCATVSENCFASCGKLETLTLSGVTTIQSSAFSDCNKMTTVSFGSALVRLYDRAFYNCALLDSISLPATVERIGENCFFNVKTTELTFAGSTTDWASVTLDAANWKGPITVVHCSDDDVDL